MTNQPTNQLINQLTNQLINQLSYLHILDAITIGILVALVAYAVPISVLLP